MKLLLLFIMLTSYSFAVEYIPILPLEKRVYVICAKSYVDSRLGKLCYSQCSKKSDWGNCIEWYIDQIDLNNPEEYEKFYDFEFRKI